MEDPQLIQAAVVTLTGAIGILWKYNASRTKKIEDSLVEGNLKMEAKLDKCEEKHESVTLTLIELNSRVGRMEGVEHLSNRVLEEIRAMKEPN